MITRKGFFWGIAGMLTLVSCNGVSDGIIEDIATGDDKWKMIMTVSEVETKASVDESQVVSGSRLPVRWDKSDKIKMMIGSDVNDVVFRGYENPERVEFIEYMEEVYKKGKDNQ